jgi:hypothetical protein
VATSFTNGSILTADDLNNAFGDTKRNQQNTAGTTTSTTYTNAITGGTLPSTTFVANASGRVLITATVRCFTSVTAFVRFAPEVRDGAVVDSGTVRLAAADTTAGVHQTNVQTFRFAEETYLSGLVAGSTYNVRLKVLTSTGTGTFADMELIVKPTP